MFLSFLWCLLVPCVISGLITGKMEKSSTSVIQIFLSRQTEKYFRVSLAFLVLTKTPLESIFEKNFGLKFCPIFTSIPVFGAWHAVFGGFAIAWYRAQCLKQSLRLRVPRMSRKLPVVMLVLIVLLTLGVTVVFVTLRPKSFSGSICYGYHEDYLQIVQARIALYIG